MMNDIICIATNLFRIYLIYRFIKVFIGGSVNKGKELLVYGMFFLINTALYLTYHAAWINLVSNLIGISILVSMYTRSMKTNIFVTVAIYVINAGCDAFCISLFVNYEDGKGFNQFYSIITVFLIFICELLAEKIVNHKKKIDGIQNFPLMLVPVCGIAIIVFMIYSNNIIDRDIAVISLGLLFINFSVFYLYNLLLELFTHKYENVFLQQKVLGYFNQLEIIQQGEEKVKALRHDMKHHMNELMLLAIKNDTAAIRAYIDDMGSFLQNPNELVESGNAELDSILNHLLSKAKAKEILVKSQIVLPEEMIHSFDIVVILGNILENAIEAAEQTKEKLLDICIELKQGVLHIEMENSFNGNLVAEDNKESGQGFLRTTKEDKNHHGIGLSSVRRIVEKYNGTMKVSTEGEKFKIKIILYM